MNVALLAACLWLILANVIALLPSRDRHRMAALVLIVAGIPILGWVTFEQGPVAGMVLLAAGCSVLRWPLIFLWRRLRNLQALQGPAE